MTIKEAIGEIEKFKTRTKDEYILTRLACISEDLYNFMCSPSIGERYEIGEGISEQVDKKRSIVDQLDASWVNSLSLSILTMFRYEQCKNYYNDEKNKKSVKKEIDGETWSKGITIITAILTLIIIGVAIGLYEYGIGANADGGFDYDMWAFIIAALGPIIVIIGWIAGAIWNYYHRKKYANAPYSIEELLAVKYADKPKSLLLISPTARKIRDSQIAIGKNITQNRFGDATATDGGTVNQVAGDNKQCTSTAENTDGR